VDDFVGRTSLLLLGAAAVLSLFALFVAALVRRSIVRPIRALTQRARSVAADELPDIVHEVQNLGVDAIVPQLPAFELNSRDELAELASSFSAVQNTAVDLAIEQAQARRIVSDNLVNLGRRNQSLLSRTLGFISDLEVNERDPDNLENLFRLDHLTTRMRRNAQSLLVLAGAQPTRKWSPAVLVGDVVRAALSEIESYEQVDVSDLGDVMIQGSVAAEVAHLLAELLENATSFSPPNSKVHVVGRSVPNGYQVAVIDYGLGMSPDDLARHNRQLAEVTSFDQTSSKMLGFQVVARLAARHGIRTVLAETPGKMGVTAIVNLPDSVFDSASTHVPSSMAAAQSPIETPSVTDADLAALVASEPLQTVAPMPDSPAHVVPALPLAAAEFSAPPSGVPAADLPVPVFAPPAPAVAHAPEPAPLAVVAEPQVAPRAAVPTLAAVGAITGPFVDQSPSVLAVGPQAVGAEGVSPTLPQFTAEPMSTANGLARRVKGAQMPDLGAAATATAFDRPADEVRGALSSLQAGLDRVRLANSKPTGPVPIPEFESKG
jgi:signal transduction histidine kinase